MLQFINYPINMLIKKTLLEETKFLILISTTAMNKLVLHSAEGYCYVCIPIMFYETNIKLY